MTTKTPKIALCGDFMEDAYWIGSASRISPEAPVPVVKIEDVLWMPGGAGNVRANLEAMGCQVVLPEYDREDMPVKNRLMVGDHQVARWDRWDECSPNVFTAAFRADLTEVDALVIADYNKGALSEKELEVLADCLPIATPVFVDSKRSPLLFQKYFVNTFFFPNAAEFAQHKDDYTNLRAKVFVKQGSQGIHNRQTGEIVPSQARFVRSVNGAGDSVLAGFVAHYTKTEGVVWSVDCLRYAMAAASIAVESPFTTIVCASEIEERLKEEKCLA